ncbi:MAG: PilZ domain-containing protein [Zoogloeaceae bacterium]|jgi:hypothetical protein|nr:PilZ domain-containing protein [Zoogloeaceae bacterium]
MNHETNRRHFARIHFDTQGCLSLPGNSQYDVKVLDLSLKGALVQLPDDLSLRVGQVLVLKARLGEKREAEDETSSQDLISMGTQVAHIHGQTAGLRCIEIDLDSLTHLRRLLELNLGDPSQLCRELEYLDRGRA